MNKRIIKFRVWSTRRKEFLPARCLCMPPTKNLNTESLCWQQFTGLKDKNGKEIYEGDILKHFPGFGCVWKERVSFIEFRECAFWEVHKRASFVLSDRDQSLEIIGNIFENKDLIN